MSVTILPIFLLLALLATVVLAGAVLIVAGVRGKALWSSPYCVACKYDLRGRVPEDTQQCPECGADLSGPKAVGFLRHGRRPKLIWLGIIVLISPILLTVALATVGWFLARSGPPSRHNLAQQPTSAVLAHVKSNPDWPDGWNELADRVKAGTLTAHEAEQALQSLTTYMTTIKPDGWDQPMHWQDDFLKAGSQTGLFTDQSMFDLADAFYGSTPTLDRLPRVTPDRDTLRIEVGFGSNWELPQHAGLPIELLWTIDKVTIDGEPVEMEHQSASRNRSYLRLDLPERQPGDHELEVTLDAAYIDSQLLIGFNKRNAGPDDWPQALRRWNPTVKDTLTVLSESDRPVTTSTDPALDPGPDGVSVKHLVVQPERGQKRLTLELQVKEGYIGALSYDVALDLADERRDLGRMYYIGEPNRQSYSGTEHTIVLNNLDPSAATATVTLTPNPRHVYEHAEIDKAWGEPVVIENVPVQRYDLRDDAEAQDDESTEQ